MQNIELNRLPLPAQTELLDFYEFLLQKYASTQSKNSQFEQFLSTPIKVEQLQNWTRDELHEC